MPNENIERAIKKGMGKLEGVIYEEVKYEGYGPGGVAIMVDCVTDNKNRTTAEIRSSFSKHGGNLGEAGCVGYLFDRKGLITIESGQATEDQVIDMLLDYGVEDVKTADGAIEVITSPEGFHDISPLLQNKKFKLLYNEITYIPKTTTRLDEKKASQCIKLVEILEDLDDVQNVYSNYDIPDEIMMKISEAH